MNEKSIESLTKKCNAGGAISCYELGMIYKKKFRTIGLMYNNGIEVEKDYSKAIKYYKKSCNFGYDGGCSSVGLMYLKGEGVKLNKSKALEYEKKARDLDGSHTVLGSSIRECDKGDIDSCYRLKMIEKIIVALQENAKLLDETGVAIYGAKKGK